MKKKLVLFAALLVLCPNMLFAWDSDGRRHERWENSEWRSHRQWRDDRPMWHERDRRWHEERRSYYSGRQPYIPRQYRYEIVGYERLRNGICIEERNYYDNRNYFMYTKFKEKPCRYRW